MQAKRQQQETSNAECLHRKQEGLEAVKMWEHKLAKLEAELKVKAEQIEKTSREIENANRRLQRAILERGPDVHTGKQQCS